MSKLGEMSSSNNYFDVLNNVDHDDQAVSSEGVEADSSTAPPTTSTTPGTTPDPTEHRDPLTTSSKPQCIVCKPLMLEIERMKWVSEPLIQKIEKMTTTIAELERKLTFKEKELAKISLEAAELPPPIDPSPLLQKIEDMTEIIADLERKLSSKEQEIAESSLRETELPQRDTSPLLQEIDFMTEFLTDLEKKLSFREEEIAESSLGATELPPMDPFPLLPKTGDMTEASAVTEVITDLGKQLEIQEYSTDNAPEPISAPAFPFPCTKCEWYLQHTKELHEENAELKKTLEYKEDEGRLMYAEAISQLHEFTSEKKRLEKCEKLVEQQKKVLREYELKVEQQLKELKGADLKIRMAGAGTWDQEAGGLTN